MNNGEARWMTKRMNQNDDAEIKNHVIIQIKIKIKNPNQKQDAEIKSHETIQIKIKIKQTHQNQTPYITQK
jgi:hypothetical protein